MNRNEIANLVIDDILALLRSRRYFPNSTPYEKDTVEEDIYLQSRSDTFEEIVWLVESERTFDNNLF